MDWNGILGLVIALGIITIAFWRAQPLMDFLERLLERGKTLRRPGTGRPDS